MPNWNLVKCGFAFSKENLNDPCIVITPDSRFLVAANVPNIEVRSLTSGRVIRTIGNGLTGCPAAVGRDGLLYVLKDEAVDIYDIDRGERVRTLPTGRSFYTLKLTDDGGRLILGSYHDALVLALDAAGSEVRTIEGLEEGGKLAPVQRSFIEHGAIQCGFCSPGMIMAAHDYLKKNPQPTEDEARDAISGNLCRCTGYKKIVTAIVEAHRFG